MPRLTVAATASGLLLATISVAPGRSSLAWFALVPLAWAIDGERPAKAFALGWIAGVAFFVVDFVWLPGTILRAAAISPIVASLALALLAGTLAIYVGAFAAALRLWQSRTGKNGVIAAAIFWTAL